MISGERAESPVDTIRASGVIPSCFALSSDVMTKAAAPSFSGQALPAVTVPSARKTGWSPASFSSVVPGARALVGLHDRPVRQGDRGDLALPEARRSRRFVQLL